MYNFLILLPSHPQRWWSWEHSLINFWHAIPYLKVCCPGNPSHDSNYRPSSGIWEHFFFSSASFILLLVTHAYIAIIFFFSFIFISWRLITLQHCSGFCHTLTWISHGFTCIPHPNPPSHLPLLLSKMVCVCKTTSVVSDSATLWTIAHPRGSSVHQILQARIL